jgi:TolB-like protein/DNA-binding winged helix-turn-helix (wHTH) protein/Tfp pilus assembly protein PilF/rhodanese-related sulfurtransferase
MGSVLAEAERFAFQRFTIDCRRRVLLANGKPVALHSRAFDLLVLLVRCRDHVVSRDEIIAQVWKGLAVGENNLTVQMSALRRALAEQDGEGLIITVPGSGYRFVGEVAGWSEDCEPRETTDGDIVEPDKAAVGLAPEEPVPAIVVGPVPAAEPWPMRQRVPRQLWVALLTAAMAVLVIAAIAVWRKPQSPGPPLLSIAVLPFRNLSDGGASGYMADAITDDLTTDLAHIPGSVVIARESADVYRDPGVPANRIGAALNVRYLLKGSLRDEDGVFHVNAQLIEAASNRQVWADRFEVPAGRLSDAQTTIVRRIASLLETDLTDLGSEIAVHDRPDDPDAEDLFVRARSVIAHDDSLAGYTQAQHLLERAVQVEPGFADALAELGLTLMLKTKSAADPSIDADLAEAHRVISRALKGQPNQLAFAANARLLQSDGDCMAASQSARAALDLEPNNIDALAVLAKCATEAGQLDQAEGYVRTVLQLNPDSRRNKPRLLLLSQISLLQGRYQEAIDDAYRAIAGDEAPVAGADSMGRPEYARLLLIAATALKGDVAGAQALYAAYATIWPHRSAWRVGTYATKEMVSLPGFSRFIAALTTAGMPMYADEHAPGPDPTETLPTDTDDFASTPVSVPGATTLDTRRMQALVAKGGVPVFDFGHGSAMIAGAVLVDPLTGGPVVQLDAAMHGDKSAPCVVMADGVYGSAAVTEVRRLVAAGYRSVYWYRGGEEAWVAAGLPAVDRRPRF